MADTHAGSSDQKKQERYVRNQGKFENARRTFDKLNKDINDQFSMLNQQSDVIVNSLTVQFTKDVQVSFYKQMAETFGKLRQAEGKM